jgi:5-methylcytosine-specific restriction enzyme subunit McrC
LQPFPAAACADRAYHRLNGDYAPLHALCRFFLDHNGPSHQVGERRMLPFLLQMDLLFETFVAQWLIRRLAGSYAVKPQQEYPFGSGAFRADILVFDAQTGQPLWVLDTKYKRDATPAAADIAQVVAYATAFGAPEAVLIYPSSRGVVVPITIGGIRVRTIAFDLDGDLQQAGERFAAALVGEWVT